MRLPSVSLRLKLAVVAALLTLLGTAVGLAVVYWALLSLQVAAFDTENRLLGNLILDSAVLREDQTVRIPRVVESYLTDESSVRAAQAYVDGVLIWEGGVIDAPRPLDPEGVVAGGEPRSIDEWRVSTIRDEEAGIAVQIGRPLLGVRDVLDPFGAIAVPLTLLLAALSGALGWLIVGVALQPLRRLSEAAERFEEGVSIPLLSGSDEPARLARSFASLLERLDSERVREHQFLALAAHELRTPISALRAGLEVAQSGRSAPGPAQLQRWYREARRLEVLAQNLLALSRAVAGDARFEALDLVDIVGDAYDRFQPLALEEGLELSFQAESARALGDPRLLARAIDNLVANALRFTPVGSIQLACGIEDGRAFFAVADTGPGMHEPLREGLGLRVVRAVARAHGGEFEIFAAGGTVARLSVPATENVQSDEVVLAPTATNPKSEKYSTAE